MSNPPNTQPLDRSGSEGEHPLLKAARAGRIVTYTWLIWALLCPAFLWMGRTYSVETVLGFIGVLGIGLWCAISFIPVALLIPIAFHEIGHLAAGLAVGYRPEIMHVGPWGWRRVGRQMRFYWTGEWLSFGGLAGSSPKQGRPNIRREAIRILGGPFASLLMALPGATQGYQMAILRPFFHTPMPHAGQSPLTSLSMIWGFISATAFIGSLMPFRNGPLRSDGSTLWILSKGGKAAGRYAAVIAMATDLQLGGRAADWPSNWVEDATALSDGSTDDAFGCYYAFFWHIARRDYPSAGKAILRATAADNSLPADYRAQAHLEAAYYYAYCDGDLEKAKLHFERGKSNPFATQARIEAIRLQIEGVTG